MEDIYVNAAPSSAVSRQERGIAYLYEEKRSVNCSPYESMHVFTTSHPLRIIACGKLFLAGRPSPDTRGCPRVPLSAESSNKAKLLQRQLNCSHYIPFVPNLTNSKQA
jgi:hypothetical protein